MKPFGPIALITQARIASSRLPAKVLRPLGQSTVLDLHLRRLKKVRGIENFIVATTMEPEASAIVEIATRNGFEAYRGDMDDVLGRFYQSLSGKNIEYVVRVTSDCPLIDPMYVEDAIRRFMESGADYACNCLVPTLPDGLDVEVFTFASLKAAFEHAKKKHEREHVTPFIRESGIFKVLSIEYPMNRGGERLTLDTSEDYEVLKSLVGSRGEDDDLAGYLAYLDAHPDIKKLNSSRLRNENYVTADH